MATQSTSSPENAREALSLLNEIVTREKSSRTSVMKRLGLTGTIGQGIVHGTACTIGMLERVRGEHVRVCGANVAPGVKAATKAGIVARPRDEEPEAEEAEEAEEADEEEEANESEEEEEEEEEEEDHEEEELEENDSDEDDSDEEIEETDDEEPARFGPTVPGKGAPMVSASYPFVESPAGTGKTAAAVRSTPALDASITAAQLPGILNALARTVAVVEQLGGIERAERIAAAIGGAP